MHKELKQLETKDMGMRLRKVREERKMTRETLAEKVDLSVNFIADVEYGNKSPSIRKFYSLIQALDTNADYILGGNMREIDIDEEAAEAYKEIMNILNQCNGKQLASLKSISMIYADMLKKKV
jgi:transcriptional regulator with XRE-family HTH domain